MSFVQLTLYREGISIPIPINMDHIVYIENSTVHLVTNQSIHLDPHNAAICVSFLKQYRK